MAAKDFKVQVVAESKHYPGYTNCYSENILFKVAFDSCIDLSYFVFKVNNQVLPFYFITVSYLNWDVNEYLDASSPDDEAFKLEAGQDKCILRLITSCCNSVFILRLIIGCQVIFETTCHVLEENSNILLYSKTNFTNHVSFHFYLPDDGELILLISWRDMSAHGFCWNHHRQISTIAFFCSTI